MIYRESSNYWTFGNSAGFGRIHMIAFWLSVFTLALILISLFMIFMVLLQRADANAGLGTAFGGGVAESTFGSDAGNVLTKSTQWAAAVFFLICTGLYLGHIRMAEKTAGAGETLPQLQLTENATEAAAVDGSGGTEMGEENTAEMTDSEGSAAELSLPEDEWFHVKGTGEIGAVASEDSATASGESEQAEGPAQER